MDDVATVALLGDPRSLDAETMDRLLTEGLQDGRVIEGIRIENRP
jgi:hypothetical protein